LRRGDGGRSGRQHRGTESAVQPSDAPDEPGQMLQDDTDEFGYRGVVMGSDVTSLTVEYGGYGDGDVADLAHRFGSLVLCQ
jgi:hypothetical protein